MISQLSKSQRKYYQTLLKLPDTIIAFFSLPDRFVEKLYFSNFPDAYGYPYLLRFEHQECVRTLGIEKSHPTQQSACQKTIWRLSYDFLSIARSLDRPLVARSLDRLLDRLLGSKVASEVGGGRGSH